MISKQIQNQKGSALLMAMLGLALLSLSIFAALQISGTVNDDSQRARIQDEFASLSQSVRTLASNAEICLDGSDGPGAQQGLRFLTEADAPTTLNIAQASTINGQKVHFGSNFPGGAGALSGIASGTAVNNFNLRIDRLFVRLPAGSPAFPARYTGELVARVSSLSAQNIPLKERVLSPIVMDIDAAGNVTGCMAENANLTPQSMCAAMGCNFNPALPGQKCICPLPVVSCPAGQYIQGLNPADLTPICADVNLSCPAGQYLAGVKPDGTPACSDVAATAPPPPPTQCSPVGSAYMWSGVTWNPVGAPAWPLSLVGYTSSMSPDPTRHSLPADYTGSIPLNGGVSIVPNTLMQHGNGSRLYCDTGSDCPAAPVSWTVGANTCNANASFTTNGFLTSPLTDSTAPTTGTATFRCNSTAWEVQPGATCTGAAPPPPVNVCVRGTQTYPTGITGWKTIRRVNGLSVPMSIGWGGGSPDQVEVMYFCSSGNIMEIYCVGQTTHWNGSCWGFVADAMSNVNLATDSLAQDCHCGRYGTPCPGFCPTTP